MSDRSGTWVTLTWDEVGWGADIGVQRHLEALQQYRPDAYGYDGSAGWTVHVEGACGELAAAIALGVEWDATVNTFRVGGDVGALQVRTRSRQDYELLVRPDARDDDVYVLVVGRCPTYRVVGWCRARDAKRPEYLHTHGGRPPAYFVPQDALCPLDQLHELGLCAP